MVETASPPVAAGDVAGTRRLTHRLGHRLGHRLAHQAARTARAGRDVHPAVLVLGACAAVWIVTFSVLVVRRHHEFWDFDFDMGLYDQAVWLVANGRGFITVRGLPVFGHHAHVAFFGLAPAYWLGAGVDFLNLLQVVSLGLGVVPIYLLARERHVDRWIAAALGAVWLLHPVFQFSAWELFHPEAVAITPLLCAYLAAVRRSWGWLAFWACLAVAWKEDLALAVLAIGLLVALRGHRRAGLWTAGLALAWFLVATQALLPMVSGHSAHYGELFQGVGGSADGILRTIVTDPGEITSRVLSSESGDFAWRLVAPFAFVPLLAPGPLLVGLPQFFTDVISDVPWTRVITFRYAALPAAALALSTVEAVAWLRRRVGRRHGVRIGRRVAMVTAALIVGSATWTTIAWGPSPIGSRYEASWPPVDNPRAEVQRAAVGLVDDDANVSASYSFVSHLSHRPEIYTFPNPWRRSNYGVSSTRSRDPQRIEWLVIDRYLLGDDRALFERLIADGEFEIVFDRSEVVVARRVGSG